MGGVDPADRAVWVRQRVKVALHAAERAEASADRLARLAARQEALAASSSPRAATYAHVAKTHRRAERRMRGLARLQLDYVDLLVDRMASRSPVEEPWPGLMNAVARAAGWPRAVLSLHDDTEHGGVVAASDGTARQIHELEVVMGEGPSWEAREGIVHASGTELLSRWPILGSIVVQQGVHAVAAASVGLGATLTGTLTVLGPAEMRRDDRQLGEVAGTLGQCLVATAVSEHHDTPDLLGLAQLEDADFQPVLHQAAGVLHVRMGVRIEDAIALIRAHACADERPVAAVAADVLAGDLLEL